MTEYQINSKLHKTMVSLWKYIGGRSFNPTHPHFRNNEVLQKLDCENNQELKRLIRQAIDECVYFKEGTTRGYVWLDVFRSHILEDPVPDFDYTMFDPPVNCQDKLSDMDKLALLCWAFGGKAFEFNSELLSSHAKILGFHDVREFRCWVDKLVEKRKINIILECEDVGALNFSGSIFCSFKEGTIKRAFSKAKEISDEEDKNIKAPEESVGLSQIEEISQVTSSHTEEAVQTILDQVPPASKPAEKKIVRKKRKEKAISTKGKEKPVQTLSVVKQIGNSEKYKAKRTPSLRSVQRTENRVLMLAQRIRKRSGQGSSKWLDRDIQSLLLEISKLRELYTIVLLQRIEQGLSSEKLELIYALVLETEE